MLIDLFELAAGDMGTMLEPELIAGEDELEGVGEGNVRRVGGVEFTKPIARALLRDARLSFGARGLFAFLWDMPGNWQANAAHLTKQSPAGRDAVVKMLRELEAVGAMRYEYIRDEAGKMKGTVWVLVSPSKWAIKATLAVIKKAEPPSSQGALKPMSSAGSTDSLKTRESGNPKIGKSMTKGHLKQGSSIFKAEAGDGESESKKAAAAFLNKEPTSKPTSSSIDELMLPMLKNELDVQNWSLLKCEFDDDLLLQTIILIIKSGKHPYCSSISKALRKPKKEIGGGTAYEDAAGILSKMNPDTTQSGLKADLRKFVGSKK